MKILKTNIKHQTKEFLKNSSIHGARYIAEDHRTSIEKLIWFCIVFISAISASVTISRLWDKFQENPTITGLHTDFTLSSIEFPTVVVCPILAYDNASVYRVAKEFVGNHMNDFGSNIPLLEILTKLTYSNIKEIDKYLAGINRSATTFWNRQSLRELVYNVHVKCEDVFDSCSLKDEKEECCSIFRPIYTEQGFCYAFNSRYYGTGFSEERTEQLNEIHSKEDSWLLKIFLKEEANFFVHPTEGILTHDDSKLFTWRNGSSVDLLLSLKQTYTNEDVDQLSISQRKCIFPYEYDNSVTLDYYNDETYSFSYCMKECRMRKTLKLCNCIPPFYAPENYEKYKKCLIDDLLCIANYSEVIKSTNCHHCHLSCFDKIFEPEKLSIDFKDDNGDEIKEKYVKITISSWPTMQYKREVLFGWIDFLVSSGGTLGLFMGLSLLSIIEMLYFVIIRVVFMFVNNTEQLKEMHAKKEHKVFTEHYNLDLFPKPQKKELMKVDILESKFICVSPSRSIV